jgi:hypothetical protein
VFNGKGAGALVALIMLTTCQRASLAQQADASSVEAAVHMITGEAVPRPRLASPASDSNVEVVAQLGAPGPIPPLGQSHPHPHHCGPKQILSGCKVTIHLVGERGTIAYWVDCCHHLALIKRSGADLAFIYLTPECGDNCTVQWAIARLPNCDGCHNVWRITSVGPPELVDCCYLEVLCH